MKQIKLGLWIALAGILITSGMATAGQNGKGTFTGQQALTSVEVDNLTFLRGEEKLFIQISGHPQSASPVPFRGLSHTPGSIRGH